MLAKASCCRSCCRHRRRVYDQTGSVADSEELAGDKFNDLYDYYRGLYKKVRWQHAAPGRSLAGVAWMRGVSRVRQGGSSVLFEACRSAPLPATLGTP